MGDNVLKSRGVSPGSPSTLLRLLALLAFLQRLEALAPEHDSMDVADDFAGAAHRSKLNISQEEYETKHREFFNFVEQNQRRRMISSNFADESISIRKLFTFEHIGLRHSQYHSKKLMHLNYRVHIPEEPNKHAEVEETALRLFIVPNNCATQRQEVTLKVVKTDDSYLLRKEQFLWDGCSPKWVELDLTDGYNVNPKTQFQVSIHCEECLAKDIKLTEPYLNVIVNVRNRSRRKREEDEKKKKSRRTAVPRNRTRRRFSGNCTRHKWEVELNKLPGFGFVVQPKKFDAGLCSGHCRSTISHTHQHAVLQHIYSTINKTFPRPCCAPSKLDSLEILYAEESDLKKLKMTHWQKTKVLKCRCA